MGKYIKSHSNYVLKTKHQNTSNGTIYERDITTIGGRDRFSKGQVPVYKSGNFVITTNSTAPSYKKVSESDWHRSDAGDVWTLDVLKYFDKDEKSSYDRKIVIKKDYYDLRDFAYYGSCSEMIRASINDIISTYPGELFIPYETIYIGSDETVQYTKEAAEAAYGNNYTATTVGIKDYFESFENKKQYETVDSCGNVVMSNSVALIDDLTNEEKQALEDGIPYQREFKYITDKFGNVKDEKSLALIDNPFAINIHDAHLPKDANPLKYFAEGGIDNYVAYIRDGFDTEWKIDDEHEYSIAINSITFDGLESSEGDVFDVSGGNCPSNDCSTSFTVSITANSMSCDIDCIVPGKYIGKIDLCFKKNDYTFKTIPGLSRDPKTGEPIEVCCDGVLNFDSAGGEGTYNNSSEYPQVDSFVSSTCVRYLTVYMFMGNNNEIKYFVDDTNKDNFNIRIRPKKSVIEEYFDNLDTFEKVLLNRYSSPLYTASFELISENDYGHYTYQDQFTFPTTYGGYNLGSATQTFSTYLKRLVDVGEYYDSMFTDNLWRSMTHEAIKNFDWTHTRHYEKSDEQPFVEGGAKIQKIIRLYGRELDEVKTYIDAIDDVNTVTYDNVNNIPDYFLSDKLEDEGWDVKLVYPLILSEFVNDHDNVPIDMNALFQDKYNDEGKKITTAEAEVMNYFFDDSGETRNKITIQRVFNQDFSDTEVVPYACSNITSLKDTKYSRLHPELRVRRDEFNVNVANIETCEDGTSIAVESSVKEGEPAINGYHNDCGELIRIYCDSNKYSSADANNEFLKRLYLNSREIWRHKGTIEGIEMLLAVFGLRSKNKVYTDDRYFINQKDNGDCLSLTQQGEEYYTKYKGMMYNTYDYDIKEYTMFTTREEDHWLESKNMFELDWINSTKLVTYDTDDYKNGRYISYQGLPVAYRTDEDDDKTRYLYPYFDSNGIYDGNPYYQMRGGWMRKKPFMFDNKNNIIPEDYSSENRKNKALFTETSRNIKCVQTLQELLSTPSLAVTNGDICQVVDLSGRYAVIDGVVYPLFTEYDDSGNGNAYFYVESVNNTLSVGNAFFMDYVIISNPYFDGQKQRINLADDYYNDRSIKVYVITKEDGTYDIDVYSNESSISTFTVFENGRYMDGDNYTNYFRINNIDYSNELSVLGWQQLKDDEYEYYRLNTITDYRNGNNPHTGHMNYDNGHEYLTYFKNIFKDVAENDLIDYREYDEEDLALLEDMRTFGFSNLIDDDECEYDYDKYLRLDSKCHYFGNIAEHSGYKEKYTCFTKREIPDEKTVTHVYRKSYIDDHTGSPELKLLSYGDVYDELGESGTYNESKIDKRTEQIVNTKRMEIEFFIKNHKEYSKEWLEEVKYIDAVILPYLTQMIPSTVIWSVKYTTMNSETWNAEKKECPEVLTTDPSIIGCGDLQNNQTTIQVKT